jgi:hypothetical protein
MARSYAPGELDDKTRLPREKGKFFQTGATAEPHLASDEGTGTRSVNSEKTS